MKMIEKVAKALCKARNRDLADWPKHVETAKICIGAMRDPGQESKIMDAFQSAYEREWNAAIDAALKDE
jgi:tryptophan synthase beta subunit